MRTQQLPKFRTRMFARVLGPFFMMVATTTVARASDMRTLLSDFEASSAWPWVTGAFLLLVSLVIIAFHQYWQGAAAITVSAAGWVLALRAGFLMAFPHAFISAANAAIGISALWIGVDSFIGLVGLYLTYVGWSPASTRPVSRTDMSTQDLPRAA